MRTVQLLRLLTRSALALLFLVLVTGSTAVLAQKTIYVSTSGNNANTGLAPAQAKLTIEGALAIADDGDTISIQAGTYAGNVTIDEADDLTFEVRSLGLNTTVVIDGDLTNDADGTVIGVTGEGDFELTGDLTLATGTVQVDNFDLADDVTITRTAGTISGNIGFPSGSINVTYDGTEDVTSGAELPANLNQGTLSVELDGVLTLAQTVTVDDLNVDAGSEVAGTIELGGNTAGNVHDVTGEGTAGTIIVRQETDILDSITLGALDIRDGGIVTLDDDVEVGSVMMVPGSALDIDVNTLSISQSFTRTGGLIDFLSGTLRFIGEDDATFAGGANLIIENLDVDKDEATLTVQQGAEITGDLSVSATSTVVLGDVTITVSGGANSAVVVNGTLEQDEGAILFSAPDATLEGDFVNITVLVGANENVDLSDDATFSGRLFLQTGGIDLDGNDLSPVGDEAVVAVDLSSAGAAITLSGGTFNAEENEYSLEYAGDLGGLTRTAGGEFTLGDIRDVIVTAIDGTINASARPGGTILGDLVLEGVEDSDDAVMLMLPNAGVTVEGSLDVGANTVLDIGNGDLTLQGAAHSVEGLVVGNGVVELDAETIAVTGSTEEDDDAAELPGVTVTEGSSATLTNIQIIDGLVTLEDESSLSLGMADEMEVTGGFDVGLDASLTLTTDVNVTGGDFEGAAGASYAGSGTLVLDGAGNFGTEGESIPNVEVVQGVMLTSDVEIGNMLTVNDEIDLDGNVLTVNNALETDGGTIASDGEVVFVSTTATLGGDTTIDADVEVADATLTLVSDDGETARTLTITGDVALNGALNIGINNLELDGGDLTSDGGSIAATTGAVIISSAATIDPDGALTIPSLEVGAATTVDGGTLRVTTVLDLGAALSLNDADEDALALGPGTLIILGAVNPLGAIEPEFEGSVDIEVNVAQTSGNELAEMVGNLEVNTDYNVATDVTVTGTLTLAAELSDAAGGVVTLGPGATLRLEGDAADVLDADLEATTYNLTYAAEANQAISDAEFIADATVTTLTVDVGAFTLELDSDITVNNIVHTSGTIDLDGNDLEVTGNASLDFDEIETTGSVLSFTGPGDNTLTVDGNSVVPANLDIEIAKNSSVTLMGGNLNFRTNLQTLILTSGEFNTSATASIILFQDATTQGFTREEGTITGNVQKRLYEGDPFGTIPAGEPGATLQRSARFEFPTGAPGGDYRPMALTFLNSIEQRTDLTVRHVPQSPGGTAGLPLDGGDGVTVTGYPNFYWFVGASQSLGQAQSFNVEVTGTQLGVDIEDVEDLRIIRRFDPSPLNPWVLQGTAANYSNVVVGDDDALVRVTGSTGGIVTQGSRFTIGRTALPPTLAYEVDGEFVDLDGAVVQAAAGMTTEVNLQFSSQDVGQEATIELVDAPEWVTLEDVTGETAVISITPPVEEVGNEHEVTVAVTDPDDTVQATFTIFVVEEVLEFVVSGQPAASTTLEPGDEFSFTLTAAGGVGDVEFVLDPDDVENVTFSAEGRSATFTFAPDEDQVDETFAFSIEVTDEADNSETVEFEVTVELIPLVLGDPDRDQEVTSADASLILQAVVGLVQLSPRDEERADVSGDGSVSAFDAGLILQFLVEFIDCFPADPDCEPAGKTINPGNGDLAWGEIDRGEELTVHVPLKLTGNVSGVHAIELVANVDLGRATVAGFSGTNLPDGWQIAWKIAESGELRIAMAGATPLDHAGEIGRIAFRLEDESSTVGVTAEGRINERAFNHLGAAGVQEIPSEFALGSNYPNPFNPSTTFTYSLPETGKVLIQIYDVTGRRVRMLVNEERQAGVHSVMWDGRNDAGLQVASGMYVYQIRSGSFVQAKKMMLVK